MKLLKTLSLTTAVVLSLGLFATTSNAQPGHARWEGNNGRHLGWYKGRHRGWDRDRSWRDDDYYRRSRYRYYSYRNYYPNYYPNYRYNTGSTLLNVLGIGGYRSYGYNNGYYGASYLTSRERRKLWKRYEKNRRKNYRRYGW